MKRSMCLLLVGIMLIIATGSAFTSSATSLGESFEADANSSAALIGSFAEDRVLVTLKSRRSKKLGTDNTHGNGLAILIPPDAVIMVNLTVMMCIFIRQIFLWRVLLNTN